MTLNELIAKYEKRVIALDKIEDTIFLAELRCVGRLALTNGQNEAYEELKSFYSIAFKQGNDKRHATFYAINRYTNNITEIDKFYYEAVQKFLNEVTP